MKVIKPMISGLLWRVYRRNGTRMAVTQMVCFPFESPDRPLTEPVMWTKIASELPKDTVLDAGIPKDRGELLLSSRAYTRGGLPSESIRVRVRAGTIAKELDIYGNRTWVRQPGGGWGKSRPESFLSMPIDYQLSFGGEGSALNPTGKGFSNNPEAETIPLPNIERPDFPVLSPEDTISPAGFGPLDLSWSERRLKAGSYQPGEIGKDPPPLPANADWTLYNQAPSDQWLTGLWEGGEPYLLEGLHPTIDRQSGHLPKIRVRSFATFKGDQTESFVEIPMRIETVWLFPHLEIGIVIHRGSVPIKTDDASDVTSLLLAAEDPGENRPEGHYIAFRDRRIARDPDDLSLYGDAPLLPERLKDDPQSNIGDIRYHLSHQTDQNADRTKRILARKFEEASARDLNPAVPTDSPEASRIPDPNRTLKEKIRAIQSEIESLASKSPLEMIEQSRATQPGRKDLAKNIEEKIRESLEKIPESILSKKNLTREKLLASRSSSAPLKKDFEASLSGEIQKERFRLIGASITESSAESSETLSKTGDILREKLAALKEQAGTLVRSVHLFPPPPRDPDGSSELRQRVLEHLKTSRDFTGWSLRNADLSRIDLSGCDFSESDLIGCDFSESSLTDSRFTGSWAAHVSLCRADLSRSRWDGANLGHAELRGTLALNASFAKTVFSGTIFSDCNLSGSGFEGAELSDGSFYRMVAKGCSFGEVRFMRLEGGDLHNAPDNPDAKIASEGRTLFEHVDFSGSILEKAIFMKSDFISVNFSSCQLSQSTFLDCSGPSTLFEGAILSKAAFVQSVDFTRSSFRNADLTGANLRGVQVPGGDFRKTTLTNCDGSGGNWQYANLQGTRAISARFLKSDLRYADCRSGDFRQAVFQNTDLRFSNFSGASLYKACTSGAKIDQTTILEHALTGKTTLNQKDSP